MCQEVHHGFAAVPLFLSPPLFSNVYRLFADSESRIEVVMRLVPGSQCEYTLLSFLCVNFEGDHDWWKSYIREKYI
jgi:hypothetical protein